MSFRTKLGRARRVLGVLGRVVGVTVTFVAGVTAGVVVHLDRPSVRRVVVHQANGILRSNLRGDVHVERIGHLGLDGASGIDVRVRDPEGVPVLDATGVGADASVLAIARSALLGKGPIVVSSSLVRIGDVDVLLDTDGTADESLRLANAFMPKKTTPSRPDELPGRGVRIEAPKVRIGHAWAHGYPPGGVPVDADLRDLEARAHLDPARLEAALDRVDLEARAAPRGLDPKGVVTGRFSMPMTEAGLERLPEGIAIDGTFDGAVRRVPVAARMTMRGLRLDASIDAHDSTGAGAAELAPELTIHDELLLHAEAHGVLPHLDAEAKVALGRTTAALTASIDPGPATRIRGRVTARHVDLAGLEGGAPKTEIGLTGTADVLLSEDGPHGTAAVDAAPSVVAGQALPAVQVRASLDGERAHATLTIPDPGLRTEAVVDVAPRPGVPDGRLIHARVASRVADLHRLPIVGSMTGGSASLDAEGELTLPETAVAARARLEARDLVLGTVPLSRLDASARVAVQGGTVTVTDARAAAVRPASPPIVATAKLVEIGAAGLRVDGGVVTGVGEPVAVDLAKSGPAIDGAIQAPAIDLPLLARLAGQEDALGIETGTLSIEGRGGFRAGDVEGGVHVEVRDFRSRDVKDATAWIDASVEGRDVAVEAGAAVGDAGEVTLSTRRLVLGGHASDPESWRKAHGRLDLDASVDLARLESLVPPEVLPAEDLHGGLVLRARLGRDSEAAAPEVQLHAHTTNLALSGKAPPAPPAAGVKVVGVAPWRTVGIDFGVDVRNDATSGLTNVAFRATDKEGVLFAFDSKTILALDELIDDPGGAKAKVATAPLSARLVVPPRRLEELPPLIGLKETAGIVEAELEASGTALEPRVRFIAKGRGLRSASMPRETKADADVAFDYDGAQAKLAMKSSARRNDVLTVSAVANVKARDFLLGTADGSPPDWTGSVRASLASFPLETIPQLAAQRVRGRLSGDLALEDLHHDAKVTGHVALEDFKVGRVAYEKANLDVEAGHGKLAAKVRVEQKDGYVDASAASGLRWGGALVPSLDERQPLLAKLEARNFRAAAVQPFVATVVPTLDGRIDASARMSLTPGRPGADLEGKVVLSDGTVQPAALGEELRKVRGTITLAKDGTVTISDVSASGISGEVHAKGTAKIEGLRLAAAAVDVDIPKDKAFDVAIQGQALGEVHGSARITASQSEDGKHTKVAIAVPYLNVELPQTLKTGVKNLEKSENVRIGVYRDPGVFVKLPLDRQDTLPPPEVREEDTSRIDLDLRLGRIDIQRGNQARVGLAGDLAVALGEGTRIEGEVHATSGWADVQGKKFTVERASVTFDGKPEINPVVLATATWSSVDGTKVFVDFIGPVKTGKIVLRSEPARPRNEILAIVLFGTPDGANPTPASGSRPQKDSTTKTAVGIGGGVAAQGLTDALDDLAGIQATVRIDTTSSTNPRPEVEFQISPKVAIAFGHVLGTPPITEPDTNLAKLNYRFHRNWSLETTVGDKGKAQTDAIWQKRY